MTDDAFDRLPEDARIWVFGAERPLDEPEEARLLASVDRFLGQWAAHGAPLAAGRAWLDHQFLVVGVNESVTAPSGCSIDALVHALKALQTEMGVTLVDNAPVFYRTDDGVQRVSRAAFKKLAERGDVSLATPVFDTSITRMQEYRSGGWEGPARDRWHGRAFFRTGVS